MSSGGALEALERLDTITRRLRRDCPWDREQDERSIVPHTVEEAYELADAAERRDDRKLLDELGDVLFQVCFLALLLEERGAGDLGAVADHCREKLIRRHPHVFGEIEARTAGEVLRNWDEIKRSEPAFEDGVAETLPATLYARKVQRRIGYELSGDLRSRLESLEAAGDRDQRFQALGELMFDLVATARKLGVDPELALRLTAQSAANCEDASP